MGVKRAHLTIPVRKPDKAWFVRTHPEESYWLTTAVVDLKESRETYLVAPELRESLLGESTFAPRLLVPAITRQAVLFLWPLRLPGADGRLDAWGESASEAAKLAQKSWVRVQASMPLSAYDVYTAGADLPDPIWPELSLAEILKVAFRGKYIDHADHPVLRALRGEV